MKYLKLYFYYFREVNMNEAEERKFEMFILPIRQPFASQLLEKTKKKKYA